MIGDYLPFCYWFRTRVQSYSNLIGYLLIVHVPILSYLVGQGALFGISDYATYVIGFAIFMTGYEIFYIENDTLSIKFEKKPEFRNSGFFSNFRYCRVIFVRIACIGALYFLLGLIGGNVLRHSIFLVTIFGTFAIHNRLPEKWRIITFYSLNVLKISILGTSLISEVPFYVFCMILGAFMSVEYFVRKSIGGKLNADSLLMNFSGFLFAVLYLGTVKPETFHLVILPSVLILAKLAKRYFPKVQKGNSP